MNFARRVFFLAAVYGVLVLAPQYFMEERVGRDFPPAITHPEYFYGFAGVALAWQFVFFVIARDPVRYRPVMAVAVFEKLTFGIAAIVLFVQGRLVATGLFFGLLDVALAVLFAISMAVTPRDSSARVSTF